MTNSNKYLIREYFELCEGGKCQDFLTEQEKKRIREDGAVILTGKLQEADVQNGNGRVYPRRILEREINNYQKMVGDRRAVGELDHPDSSVVNLQNVSHLITEVWWDGSNVMGKLEVLPTPSGNILKSLVNSGVKMGISSRALGSVKQHQGQMMVEEDLQLICFDMVSEPSTPNAFMLKEHKENPSQVDKINNLLNSIIER